MGELENMFQQKHVYLLIIIIFLIKGHNHNFGSLLIIYKDTFIIYLCNISPIGSELSRIYWFIIDIIISTYYANIYTR